MTDTENPRYLLTYSHDELRLWCDECAETDERPVETWYGAPTSLAAVAAAAQRHDADRHIDEAAAAYPNGPCPECSCCVAFGCHTGPGSLCPTDALGDSVCPCTGGER